MDWQEYEDGSDIDDILIAAVEGTSGKWNITNIIRENSIVL